MTNTKILIVFLLLAAGAALAYTVYTIGAIVGIFLLALLIAFIISPAVNWLEGQGANRTLASTIMFILALAAVVVTIYFISPLIYDQALGLQRRVSIGDLRSGLSNLEHSLGTLFGYIGMDQPDLAPKIEELVTSLFANILSVAGRLVGIVLFVVMTLISTFFLLKDGPKLKKSMIEYVPNQFFEMSLSILHKIDWSLGAYLRGILLDASVIAVLTTFAMWLIGTPNFFLIGFVAGFANLVPYLGPPTAALVASIISVLVTNSFDQVPLIIITFGIIRLIDDSVVQPVTISKSVRLHPLTIIFTILIGGHLFGILGMLFAVPVAGVFKVVASELYFGLKRYRTVY